LRELCGIGALITREKVVVVIRFTWSEISMFDLFLAALSLAPLGLFLLFWRVFPRDSSVHPIYREPEIETIGKRTEVQDMPSGGCIRERFNAKAK
jgi:hypothetical protein